MHFFKISLALIALGTTLVHAQDKRTMTVDDVLEMVQIDDILMTPDGARVFYSERRLNWETNKYEKTLFIVSSNGSSAIPFVGTDKGDSFQLSPDGKFLSMLRKVKEKPQIFVMPLSGGEAWQSTDHRGTIKAYKWSGTSDALFFVSEDAMSVEEEKEFKLGADPIFVNEGPNGKNHGRWTSFWLTSIESKDERRLTEEPILIGAFDVSPDGRQVIYTARRDYRGNFPFLSELYLLDVASSEITRLTDNRALEGAPVWAPDGTRFVYHASDDQVFDLRNGYLWIMDPSTRKARRLEGQRTGEIDHLVWTADGKYLLFNEVHGTNTNLCRMEVSSGELSQVTHMTGTFRARAYSKDRARIAYTFQAFDTPEDLYGSDIEAKAPTRLTHVNPWVEDKILLPKADVVRWESHDGMPIEGIFLLPDTYRAGDQVPLILEIHGGPSGFWANAFEPELIIYTGLGYSVLGPNVRGSSGYGDELLRGLMGDVGGGEYHDLMTGVDHVIQQGYVDPQKMGVAGWSWGGVSAGWVITQTNRFKAASVGAGVSNWIGESGPGFNWDISNWYVGGKHWTRRDEWRNRSAINFVENVETPTLFLHGAKDQTSSTNQSMVYFDALQERGIPTRYIKFPRQGHGIREPRLRRIRIIEEIRWMQKYIHGEDWKSWERASK